MFVMILTEVQTEACQSEGGVQTKCGQFVSEFVGNDRVEGGAVVDEEYPEV